MTKDLENKLFNDFPLIFRSVDDDDPIVTDGIRCDDGWFDLIYDLSNNIEKYVQQLLKDKIYEADVYPRVFQIKEKFGMLRYNMTEPTPEYIIDLIEKAEVDSSKICEKCGSEGKKVTLNNVIRVVCDCCIKKL